jgi:hypothetical protein
MSEDKIILAINEIKVQLGRVLERSAELHLEMAEIMQLLEEIAKKCEIPDDLKKRLFAYLVKYTGGN